MVTAVPLLLRWQRHAAAIPGAWMSVAMKVQSVAFLLRPVGQSKGGEKSIKKSHVFNVFSATFLRTPRFGSQNLRMFQCFKCTAGDCGSRTLIPGMLGSGKIGKSQEKAAEIQRCCSRI